MRYFIIVVSTLGLLAASLVSAWAAEITASITHIDVQARIIVIDHRAFHLPKSIKIGAFKVGEQVTVVYEVVNGQLKIVSIRIG
ncbi:MAG: DUF1344 domain-containing protein [Stappiaceae bacterium]